jgi:nucleoside-diphosphate-sugar epimerase
LSTTEAKYKQIVGDVNLSGLRNKAVFMTGGTGFFGYWTLKLFALLHSDGFGIDVTLLSRDPDSFLNKNPEYKNAGWLHWVKGDVTNYTFSTQKFDFFIHGAANTTPTLFEKPTRVFEEIVFGTKHVLEHAVNSSAKRVLIISSGAVYGEVSQEIQFISEDHNSAPETNTIENAYGEAKRASEMLAYCYAKESGIEVVTARCFAFAGFGIGPHLVLNIFIRQALKESELSIKSNGRARRSFLHGRDLAIWLLKILVDGKNGELYNVGSDNAHTIKALAELVRDIVSPGKEVHVLGSLKKEQRVNYIPSVEKAKLLGLEIWTSLRESILEMKETLTNNDKQ